MSTYVKSLRPRAVELTEYGRRVMMTHKDRIMIDLEILKEVVGLFGRGDRRDHACARGAIVPMV